MRLQPGLVHKNIFMLTLESRNILLNMPSIQTDYCSGQILQMPKDNWLVHFETSIGKHSKPMLSLYKMPLPYASSIMRVKQDTS